LIAQLVWYVLKRLFKGLLCIHNFCLQLMSKLDTKGKTYSDARAVFCGVCIGGAVNAPRSCISAA
jgi:hypothetical protein